MFKEPDSWSSFQQTWAAGDHLLGTDHIIPVQLDQAKLVDAPEDQVCFLGLYTSGCVHSPAGFFKTTSQEFNNQETRGRRWKNEDTIRTEQEKSSHEF